MDHLRGYSGDLRQSNWTWQPPNTSGTFFRSWKWGRSPKYRYKVIPLIACYDGRAPIQEQHRFLATGDDTGECRECGATCVAQEYGQHVYTWSGDTVSTVGSRYGTAGNSNHAHMVRLTGS